MKHCLVFDIGKTNKKAFVFDEDYRIVYECAVQLPETVDDDGDPCENIALLKQWVEETAADLRSDPRFQIAASNCTAYGASFVHLDENGRPVAPLYNYLKPFPDDLMSEFLQGYGPSEILSLETASPLLGNLNSGLQLLLIKYRKPRLWKKIKHSFHLPQWIASLISEDSAIGIKNFKIDMTSLGCHTMLWNFREQNYHAWAQKEEITRLLPAPGDTGSCLGLHDSSAALIPYLSAFPDIPFLLVSTGTWCISLNPFNEEPLTAEELQQDCLCYMTSAGKPVKASRYFGGNEHDEAVKAIAAEYHVPPDFYKTGQFPAAMEAYSAFMEKLMERQITSVRLALGGASLRRIFVDGGFSKNEVYMNGLATAFPEMEVYSAAVAQATALGAALHVHEQWNDRAVRKNLIELIRIRPPYQ